MSAETWKPCPSFKGYYEVSDLGQVRSLHGSQVLVRRPTVSTQGYLQVHLTGGGLDKVLPVHRLVALAFLTPVSGKTGVNHKDGNKFNNRVANLEFCDVGENNRHALRTGLRVNPSGSANGMAKLNEAKVAEIRGRLAAGEGQTAIAKDYGVTNKLVHLIAKGKVWRQA